MRSGIYRITNRVSGGIYVGSAKATNRRITTHKVALNAGKHKNQKLQRAWDKYGADAFVFEVIEHVDDLNALVKREQHWIDHYKAAETVMYNIALVAGNTLGCAMSEATRRKISASNTGKKHSEESRRRMAEKAIGRVYSAERNAKIAATKTGHIHSEATRLKMSLAQKRRQARQRGET